MSSAGILVFALIVITILVSYKGFNDRRFFDGYKFQVGPILHKKDYKRLITSGFLHVNWMHLIFNMIGLFMFSGLIASTLGGFEFLLIYFVSLLGGELLSLVIHRHHGDYSSVGSSGAVCGVLFATVAIYPDVPVGLFILPPIPGWIYALIFVLVSIYGIRSQKRNIGHDAHLGGALIGMILALTLHPSSLIENYGKILIILIPTIAFIYVIIKRPTTLLVNNLFYNTHQDFYSIDHKYNAERADKQQEVDRILEKISKRGMSSLTRKEKETLKEYSKHVR